MTRRSFIQALALGLGGWLAAGRSSEASPSTAPAVAKDFDPLEKPRKEWRALLDPQAYDVLFEAGTERPFSSALNSEKRDGTYLCAACFLPLFEARTKYDSRTGWPSFWTPIEGRLDTKVDFKLIFPRTEYHCARCRGHQGHLFKDGPQPTGQRWCNNGVALRFVPRQTPLPELRT